MHKIYHAWTEEFEKEKDSYAELVKKDLFADWSTSHGLENRAERQLNYGLAMRYVRDPACLAEQFFHRCISIVDRMVAENWYPRRARDISPPVNRAIAHRARCFAVSLLGGALDTQVLVESALLYIEWALDERWDDIAQASYLTGVRLSLIAGDIESAKKLVRKRKRFSDHPVEFGLLQDIVNQVDHAIGDTTLLQRFDEYFEPIRSPDFISPSYMLRDNTRFELGIIRHMFLIRGRQNIDWNEVISSISGG